MVYNVSSMSIIFISRPETILNKASKAAVMARHRAAPDLGTTSPLPTRGRLGLIFPRKGYLFLWFVNLLGLVSANFVIAAHLGNRDPPM
jgi:hypothetical protein